MATHTKKATSFLLSEQVQDIINDLALELGIYQSAEVEQAIRRFSQQKQIKWRDEETKKISFWISRETKAIIRHFAKTLEVSNSAIVEMAILQLRDAILIKQNILDNLVAVAQERFPVVRLSNGKLRPSGIFSFLSRIEYLRGFYGDIP